MTDRGAGKREYRVVIYGSPALFRRSCRMMACFLKECGLDPADGITLLIGEEIPKQAEEMLPTKKAVFLQADCGDCEEALQTAASLCREQLILFAPDPFCEEMAVRLSARLDGTAVTDALSVRTDEDSAHVKRRIYGGHLKGTFRLSKAPFLISIDRGCDEAEPVSGQITESVALDTGGQRKDSDRKVTPVPAGTDLEEAKTAVIGGRGLRSGDGAAKLSEMAEQMGASVGGSRPVIMNAWMEREKLVGVSGTMIRPELCIVCGASGSPAFYEGIKRSRTIIAINTDQRAPIMKKSDACVCADWREIMRELTRIRQEG